MEENKLTVVPKNIKLGRYGGLYYKNTNGKYTWLKPPQKKKVNREILKGGYGLSYRGIMNEIDQIYIPQDKKVLNKLIPVPKEIYKGPGGGYFYFNKYGHKIYLNKSQKRDWEQQVLKGGYSTSFYYP